VFLKRHGLWQEGLDRGRASEVISRALAREKGRRGYLAELEVGRIEQELDELGRKAGNKLSADTKIMLGKQEVAVTDFLRLVNLVEEKLVGYGVTFLADLERRRATADGLHPEVAVPRLIPVSPDNPTEHA
jgi:hypothetical protein